MFKAGQERWLTETRGRNAMKSALRSARKTALLAPFPRMSAMFSERLGHCSVSLAALTLDPLGNIIEHNSE